MRYSDVLQGRQVPPKPNKQAGKMTFAEKVKEVRGRLYLTQEQLAEKLGVSFSTLNRWEKGHHDPTFLAYRKFQDFCKANNIIFEDDK